MREMAWGRNIAIQVRLAKLPDALNEKEEWRALVDDFRTACAETHGEKVDENPY